MNELNMMHSVKYPTAIDVARKFVDKTAFRMVLKFVRHTADGSIIATDSHRLLKVKNVHGFDKDLLVNPSTLDFATGNYPDIDKILPTEFKTVFGLDSDNIKVWLQMHKSMNQMAKASKVRNIIKLNMNEDGFNFELDRTDITFKMPCSNYNFGGFGSIAYCCEYMRDALEAHQRLGSEKVKFDISGTMKAFVLNNGEDVETVLLPVRMG